jgi:hypothetical protein
LGRGVEKRLEKENKDFTYPFLQVADILKKGDIVFGNWRNLLRTAPKAWLESIREVNMF